MSVVTSGIERPGAIGVVRIEYRVVGTERSSSAVCIDDQAVRAALEELRALGLQVIPASDALQLVPDAHLWTGEALYLVRPLTRRGWTLRRALRDAESIVRMVQNGFQLVRARSRDEEGRDWLSAFPIRPATAAVDALCGSWEVLSSRYRREFNPRTREPKLTRVLKAHVERVTARERGLLGMWAAESVENEVDFDTGELKEERRTDIVYGWNNDNDRIRLVFEFKKLGGTAESRSRYLGGRWPKAFRNWNICSG